MSWLWGVAFDTTSTISGIFLDVGAYWLQMTVGRLFRKGSFERRMADATLFEDWYEAAKAQERYDVPVVSIVHAHFLFRLTGGDKWKRDPVSVDYDYDLIANRLLQLQTAREMGDMAAISFLMRTSIARNFGGIANRRLYEKCPTGTKQLIEDFVDELLLQLKQLSQDIDTIDTHVLLRQRIEFFRNLRHTLGNTALLLSGGGSLGVYHLGVLQAIFESGMFPRIITGSSSGSIIAAILCTHSEDDYLELMQFKGINFHFLEEPSDNDSFWKNIRRKIERLLSLGTIFDSEHFQSVLRENIGDYTFLEAFRKTERVLNITASSPTSFEMPNMLNYITAPDVVIWSAVMASCAIPGCFKSVELLAKDLNGVIRPWHSVNSRWIDGSVANDIPLNKLAELFNVNHFIVSQVNPHIYPFVAFRPGDGFFGRLYGKVFYLVMSELEYRLKQFGRIGVFRKSCHYMLGVLKQPYQGDITIVPHLPIRDMVHMLNDLDRVAINDAITSGLQAAWPKLSIIKMHCAVEMSLDDILFRLKSRLQELTCPNGHSSSESLEIEDVERLFMDSTMSVKTFSDSVILQGEDEQPSEFAKPSLRVKSFSYSQSPSLEPLQ